MRLASLEDIKQERERQDRLWGIQNHHPERWLTILGEEYGEACKAVLECSLLQYRDELVRCAAVAITAIECLDRGEWEQKETT